MARITWSAIHLDNRSGGLYCAIKSIQPIHLCLWGIKVTMYLTLPLIRGKCLPNPGFFRRIDVGPGIEESDLAA